MPAEPDLATFAPAETATRLSVRASLRVAVVPWALSRILAFVALAAAGSWPFDGPIRFASLTNRWDGNYYLDIARVGYGPVDVEFPKWAFFPGLPSVIRVLDDLGLDEVLWINVVNQLALLVALAGVYRLAARRGSPAAASLAVWALALFPASFVFSMTYPSALFLAASVWAFVLVEERVDVAASALVVVATMIRPNGFVLALALVVALRSLRRIVVVCAPATFALVAWCWYCWDRTGDALVWMTTKSRWEELTIVDVLTGHEKLSLIPHLTLGAAALAVVVMQRRRLPASWLVFTALYLLPALVSGIVGLARYTNECFPSFVAAGQVLDRWPARLRVITLAGSASGLVLFAFVVGRYGLVP